MWHNYVTSTGLPGNNTPEQWANLLLNHKYVAADLLKAHANGYLSVPGQNGSQNGHAPPVVADTLPLLGQPEQDFWSRPVHQHLLTAARAHRMAPWGVLMSTLARVVATVHPSVVLPATRGGLASLNLYVALIAPSGLGKNSCRSVSLMYLNIENEAPAKKLGSGEGIAGSYMKRNRQQGLEQYNERVLFIVDEIDALAAVKGRAGATLMPELRTAWMGTELGFAYRSAEANLPVSAHSYRLCLLTGAQPGRAGALLQREEVEAGTPQRFIWTELTDAGVLAYPPSAPAPVMWRVPLDVGLDHKFGKYVMRLPADVQRVVDAEAVAVLRGQDLGIGGHRTMCRIKVAASLAILDQRWSVTDQDWEFASTVMQHSDTAREKTINALTRSAAEENVRKGAQRGQQDLVADETGVRQTARRLLTYIGTDWIAHAALKRKCASGGTRERLDRALALLVSDGEIKVEEVGTPPGTHYRRCPKNEF